MAVKVKDMVHIKKDAVVNQGLMGFPGVTYCDCLNSSNTNSMSGGTFNMEPNSTYDDEGTHEEIFFVTKGRATITSQGRSFTVKEGDFGYIPKGAKSVFKTDIGLSKVWVTYPHFE